MPIESGRPKMGPPEGSQPACQNPTRVGYVSEESYLRVSQLEWNQLNAARTAADNNSVHDGGLGGPHRTKSTRPIVLSSGTFTRKQRSGMRQEKHVFFISYRSMGDKNNVPDRY